MGQGQPGRLPELLLRVRRWPCHQLDHREDGALVQRHPQHPVQQAAGKLRRRELQSSSQRLVNYLSKTYHTDIRTIVNKIPQNLTEPNFMFCLNSLTRGNSPLEPPTHAGDAKKYLQKWLM